MKAAQISRNINFSAICMCRATPPTDITFLILLKPEELVFPLLFHSVDSGDESEVRTDLPALFGVSPFPSPSCVSGEAWTILHPAPYFCPSFAQELHWRNCCCDEIHLVLSEGLARIMLKKCSFTHLLRMNANTAQKAIFSLSPPLKSWRFLRGKKLFFQCFARLGINGHYVMKLNKINTSFAEIFPNPLFFQQNVPALRSSQISGVWELFLWRHGWSSLTTLSSVLHPSRVSHTNFGVKNQNRIGSSALHRLSGICELWPDSGTGRSFCLHLKHRAHHVKHSELFSFYSTPTAAEVSEQLVSGRKKCWNLRGTLQ